jgi:hypothetical protein
MSVRLTALFLIAGTAAFGGDAEFDHIVKAIETHYGTQRTHIPFMGVANLFVKIKKPEGVSSFKLALFEDLKSSPGYREWADLDRFMDSLPGELRPLVRVHSRRAEESTYIFAGPAGKSTKMLLATFESNEATVIEVKVDMDMLLKSLDDPEHAHEILGVRDR